jgi:hypothetical protein
MSAGPVNTMVVIVPVPAPTAGSPGWARQERLPAYRRHHADRVSWERKQPIPDRVALKRDIRELLDRVRADRERALETAKAALDHVRMAEPFTA